MIGRIVETLAIACIGAVAFSAAHIPLPWMLGPLASVFLWRNMASREAEWPLRFCQAGLMLLGYTIGHSFTHEAVRQIMHHLPIMSVTTLAVMALCLYQGFTTHKKVGISLASGLLGSLPGGVHQVVILCRETPGADLATVTFMQTSRQLAVVFVVPFLVMHGLADLPGQAVQTVQHVAAAVSPEATPQRLLFLAAVMVGSGFLASCLHIPNPFMLGPVIATACLVLNDYPAPNTSRLYTNAAQLCVGAYTGARITLANLRNWRQLVIYTLFSVGVLVVFSLVSGYVLAELYGIPLVTAFLSTAAGGMTELSITAMMVNADLSTVVTFHLFRVLFAVVLAPPSLKWYLGRVAARNRQPEPPEAT